MDEMKALEDVLVEGLDDWVPIDQLLWAAGEYPAGRTRQERLVELLRYALSSGLVEVGELMEAGFAAWTGDVDEQVRRVTAGLDRLDWAPQLGSSVWLSNTAKGDEVARRRSG
ncbi:hypothetical protein OG257_24225 [Streptomyces sp. NBC_00683]|uniref:hypothetical protein n=1 Tax=Streptomyces sp. NBC_00683 TaxID=2903670 RepID=UPI002E351F92|nr:hypothetical protein [Streptomyces sp. NBC_00683]